MKKILAVTFLATSLLAINAVAAAADGKGAPPDHAPRIEQMQTELGLTAAQVTQIKQIEAQQKTESDALRTEYDAKIKAVLTTEQAEKFTTMQNQRQQGKGKMQPPPDNAQGQPPAPPDGAAPPSDGNPPPRPAADGKMQGGDMLAKLKTDLGLSDEQASQIESIMQEQRTAMDALRTETQNLIKAVLTTEQAAKWAASQPQPPAQ